jgi:hypothetical protein
MRWAMSSLFRVRCGRRTCGLPGRTRPCVRGANTPMTPLPSSPHGYADTRVRKHAAGNVGSSDTAGSEAALEHGKGPPRSDRRGASSPGDEQSDSLAHLNADIAMVLAVMASVVVLMLRDQLLPAKFSYDADHIARIAQRRRSPVGDESFERIGQLYALLGLGDRPGLASFLGFALVVLAVTLVRRELGDPPAGVGASFVAFLAIFLGAVYLGTYSKETLVVLVSIAFLVRVRSWQWDAFLVAAMVAYAAAFRPYWVLVAALYVAFRFAYGSGRRPSILAGAVLLSLLSVSLTFYYVLGVAPDYYRTDLNAYRIGRPDAATMMTAYVEFAQPLGGAANVLISFMVLLLPLPLLLEGGPYYTLLAVTIGGLWGFFAVAALRVVEIKQRQVRDIAARCVCLVMAFVTTQAFFEPDYGSAFRHLAPLLPLMLYVVWATSSERLPRGTPAEDPHPDTVGSQRSAAHPTG